jgi:hypothetical protein
MVFYVPSLNLDSFQRYHSNVINSVFSGRSSMRRRYLADQIDWSELAIMLIGQRGVGKTTLLVQHAVERYGLAGRFLYLSGDFFQLVDHGLYHVADRFFAETAGECLIVDEVHRYPTWKQELKNILDAFKTKQILISGSSSLHLTEGTDTTAARRGSTTDLQRRRAVYELRPLSFREYLGFKWSLNFAAVSVDELLNSATTVAATLVQDLAERKTTVLKEFEGYLVSGYYPYFLDAPSSYLTRLEQTIETVISQDIALVMSLDAAGVAKLKRLFAHIASSKPMTPNINALARDLGATRDTIYKYLFYLERAGLVRTLFVDKTKSGHILNRPDKVCVSNPNILNIAVDARIASEFRGAARESFFVGNFNPKDIAAAKDGDFRVDDHVFEIGGPSKTGHQLPKDSRSFVVKDGIEWPSGKVIPLWMFGFLY